MAKDWTQVYKNTAIETAQPIRILLLLFEGLLRSLDHALMAFDSEENIIRRNETIHNNLTKAQNIIDELNASLNASVNVTFVEKMTDLYHYALEQVKKANHTKSPDPIREIYPMLQEIYEAWLESSQNGH